MKGNLLIIITMIVATIAIMILFRFDVDIQSPVVSKFDRWTGKAWIVNNGVWMPVKAETKK